MPEFSAVLTAPPGGVFTDEVGVITGELELHTTCDDGGLVTVRVRYAEADEWYTVRGCSVGPLRDPADAQAVHDALVGVLHRPEG